MKRYVVVVNYYTSLLIADAVKTMSSSGAPVDAVIIVDNSGDDRERALLETIECRGAETRVIAATSNLGFGAAVNLGVASIGARAQDLIWILNPDTRPDPSCLQKLEDALSAPGQRIVSPLVTFGDEPRVWFAGGNVKVGTGRVEHIPYDVPPSILPCEPYATEMMCGAAPALLYETWKQLGGFREDLFMYWEDVDWSIKARSMGVELIVVPTAVCWHKVGASSGEDGQSTLFYYYSARNRAIVCKAWGASCFKPGFLLETFRFSARAVRREQTQRFKKACLVLRGSLDGARFKP